MDIPVITNMTSMGDFLLEGTNGMFFSILMIPIFFILLISFRNSNAGDNIDSLNMASFICLMLSFVLSALGWANIMVVGIFLVMLLLGLILKRFTN